jgi:hypothetical protein
VNSELLYRCYVFNRKTNSANLLAPWFRTNGKAFEARYQAEQKRK